MVRSYSEALDLRYRFCPHFAHTFPGTSGKLRDIAGYHTIRSHATKRWNTNEKQPYEAVRKTTRKHTSYIYRVYEYDFKGFYFA